MAKRQIPEIDETGELLEKIEGAEKARRKLLMKLMMCQEAHKETKKGV